MQAVIGAKLQDTQTGLRGIPSCCCRTPAAAGSAGLRIRTGNADRRAPGWASALWKSRSARFTRPATNLRTSIRMTDSMKIYFVLLRFSSVSLMTALHRQPGLLLRLEADGLRVGIAGRGARWSRSIFNYSMVRKTVFASKGRPLGAAAEIPAAGGHERNGVVSGDPVSHGAVRRSARCRRSCSSRLCSSSSISTIQRTFIFDRREPGERPARARGPLLYAADFGGAGSAGAWKSTASADAICSPRRSGRPEGSAPAAIRRALSEPPRLS